MCRAMLTTDSHYSDAQRSNARFMDAHEGVKDNDVVTRNAQKNATQQWKIVRRTQPTPQGPPAPVLKREHTPSNKLAMDVI